MSGDVFDDGVNILAGRHGGELGQNGGINFAGKYPIVYRPDLLHPGREILPDRLATEEIIGRGVGSPFARRKEGPQKYGWRAVAERPNGHKGTRILVLVDETETRDSVRWLLLHEFAHALVTATPTLAETLRAEKRPEGYPENDDAHEAVFEEEVANAFADRLAPVPGLDRRWWRERTRRYVTPTIYGAVGSTASSLRIPLVASALLVAGLGYALMRR